MEKQGIIEYSIIRPTGNPERDRLILTGIFTNLPNNGEFFNEIARKQDRLNEIVGRYRCVYLDDDLSRCILEISPIAGRNNVFNLIWFSSNDVNLNEELGDIGAGREIFRGIGFRFPNDRMIVHYTWE